MRTIHLSGVSIVLSAFSHLSQGSASHLTVQRTIWSEWTWFGLSPLALCNFPPWESFWTVQIYHVLYLLYMQFMMCFNDSHLLVQIFVAELFHLLTNANYWWLMTCLFCYCSFFWYWKCIPGILTRLQENLTCCEVNHKKVWLSPSRVNKHHASTRLAFFGLSIGFLKTYHHNRG
jgi:hypothetical protein